MQTSVDAHEAWPLYYDAQGYPIFRHPDRLLPSTTIIIYEPYVYHLAVTWAVLCHQRRDNQQWGFVGGAQEIGESLATCARREALEETGLTVVLERMVCVDSDPAHGAIHPYPDGHVVQYTNVTFLARATVSMQEAVLVADPTETTQIGWFPVHALPTPFSPLHTWRLHQALAINQHPPVR